MLRLFEAVARVIQAGLDVILPRRDRVIRSETYRIEDLTISPREQEIGGVPIITLLSYKDQASEDIIRALKFDRSSAAIALLAHVLAEYLREEIASLRIFSARKILIVPVPLHVSRERERGYNQMQLILEALPEEFKNGTESYLAPHALVRVRATHPQTHLPRDARQENVRDAFAVRDVGSVIDTHIILIDDVATTGATLREAAKPLLNLDIPVTAIALARA